MSEWLLERVLLPALIGSVIGQVAIIVGIPVYHFWLRPLIWSWK